MTKSTKRSAAQQAELDKVLAAHVPINLKAPAKKAAVKAVVPKADKPKAERAGSKAEKARAIFLETLGQERKVILNRFVSEAGLTVAGANTYLANFRKDSGLK